MGEDIAFEWIMEAAAFQSNPQCTSWGAGGGWGTRRPRLQGWRLQKGDCYRSRGVGLRAQRWTSAREFVIKDALECHLPPWGVRLVGLRWDRGFSMERRSSRHKPACRHSSGAESQVPGSVGRRWFREEEAVECGGGRDVGSVREAL